MNIIKKTDSLKILHLNSRTNQSSEYWPMEPLATHLARANKKYNSASDQIFEYAYGTLDDKKIKLAEISSGENLFAFLR